MFITVVLSLYFFYLQSSAIFLIADIADIADTLIGSLVFRQKKWAHAFHRSHAHMSYRQPMRYMRAPVA
jgi:hypothetical protein